MAHFAKIGLNGKVIEVLSVVNEVLHDANGVEQETIGIDFLKILFNEPNAVWKQTSYNNNIRKNYAGIGYAYDETRDAFIPPKPFESWLLNEDTCQWESPVAYPETYTLGLLNEDNITPIKDTYKWNEEILNWELMNG
jgi:hypothetical protein